MRVRLIVGAADQALPAATWIRGYRNPAEAAVPSDTSDERLGTLFHTLALDAGATELDYS